ncbi:MAG: HAMP domain-containing histidine kinase [Acidimicrobiales bacterium]|nr:HAMP domain-containing histidine kinase [Acidimicrobiales bacterium]
MTRPGRRRRSLRATLVVAMVGVAAVALAAAFLVARTGAGDQLDAFYESYTLGRDVRRLDEYRNEQGSWEGVGPLLAEIGRPYDERLVLTTPDGELIADSEPDGPAVDVRDLDGDVDFIHGDDRAVLYTLGRARSDVMDDTRRDLDRWYLAAGAAALVVAAGTAWLVGRRIARPLTAVAATAERMGSGDLAARAGVDGPREVAAVARSLDSMAEALQEADEQRRTMVADVAHELRSPVANLRAYVEAMVDGVAEPSGEDLAVLVDEVHRLDHLIGDLQELALAEAGEVRLDPEPVDVGAALERAAVALRARADEAGVALEVEAGPTCPRVVADPGRLQQILANLTENALRHSPPGSLVTLTARGAEAAGEEVVEVQVLDEGPGLGGDAERVFDRFWRADASRTRTSGGAGLGLAISRRLAELSGGTLVARNRETGGAAFVLTLPSV